MNNRLLYIGADTPALTYARHFLEDAGFAVAAQPSNDVTHLLLNVPTFTPTGSLAGGKDLKDLLTHLPASITIIGGNLNAPIFQNYSTIDLLQKESYLAQNAAVTAECALQVAYQHRPGILRGNPILILGWGRIGKCLAKLLHGIGADVTLAARKEADLAMITALGYTAVPLHQLRTSLCQYRIIFNTVPFMVLPETPENQYWANCLKIDLASTPGIGGGDVITARGLPGKLAPEAAGRLIAATIQKEVLT